MEKKTKFKIYSMGESLLFAVFFLLLGLILITNPDGIFKIILYVLGTFAIVVSVFKLLLYYKVSEYVNDKNSKKDLIRGIIMLLFGTGLIVVTTAFYTEFSKILGLALSLYLLFVGIVRVVNVFKVAKKDRLPFIINAGIVILISLVLFLFPKLPYFVIGIFLIIYSITEIYAFAIDKKTVDKKDDIKEADIVRVVENKRIESKEE